MFIDIAEEEKGPVVRVKLEDIELVLSTDQTVWLMRPGGEGMGFSVEKFEAMLDDYYKQNF